MSSLMFPRIDIPESKKDESWCRQVLLYAESVFRTSSYRVEKFTRLMNGYNGRTSPNSIKYLTQTYGKQNKTKYVSYRVGRPKIDLINNEFLLRPLQATVYTVNIDSKVAKLDQYEQVLGSMHAKEPIEKLRSVGIDPLEGAPIPTMGDESVWSSMSGKDKNESLMQTILNEQIPSLSLKEKLTKNFQDLELTSMCYGKVEVDYDGNENYRRIDPRLSIFEEIEGDTFMEKSPLMGELRRMPVHEVLLSFKLTQTQRDYIDSIRANASTYIADTRYNGSYSMRHGQFFIDVITVEWVSVAPEYYKISPKTKTQMAFDDSTDSYTKEISVDDYEKNKLQYDKDVLNGKYKIETKYKKEIWQATKIGHELVVDWGRKPFTMRSVDNPGDVSGFSYCGALFNTVNGERISLQEIIENFDNIFDVIMFQILRELNKAKGKIIGYNRAMLPKGKSMKEIMYDSLNDSFVDYDTSAAGNMGGRDLDLKSMFQEIDLGLSASFPSLITLKQDILQTLDRLTGINENREGQIKASSTASNANSAIQASRTITEGLFFIMGLYTEKVLMKLIATTKLTWGLYKTEKAKIILGGEKFAFMQATRDIALADYGIHLLDGGRELDIRQKLEKYADVALNSKEIRFKDIVAFELQETLADAESVLKKAFKEMDDIRQRDAKFQADANAQTTDKQMQTQIQIAREDREDRQKAALDEINTAQEARASAQILIDDNKMGKQVDVNREKAKNDLLVSQNEIEQNAIHSYNTGSTE